MNLLREIVDGVTDEDVYKRIGCMFLSLRFSCQ